MFCLYLQLDGLRQLERIRPTTGRELTGAIEQILIRSGATRDRHEAAFILYTFPRSCEADHRVVLDAALDTLAELQRYDDELTGYTVVIDYIGREPADEAFRRLRGAVSRFTEDRAAWIGPGAAGPLAGEAEVSPYGEYQRIENPERPKGHSMASCTEFLRNDEFIDEALDLLEPWINGIDDAGLLLIRSDDPAYSRANVQQLVRRIYGSAADRPIVTLFASEREDEQLAPIANSIVPSYLEQTAEWLGSTERHLWEEVSAGLVYTAESPTVPGLFDHLERDLVPAYALYLTAVLRSLRRDLLPFIVVLEEVDRFSVELVLLLRRVYDRLARESAPILIATSRVQSVPVGLADLQTLSLELPLFSGEEVAGRADEHLSEAAERQIHLAECMRRTRGVPLELYYYFVNVQDMIDRPASRRTLSQRSSRGGEAPALLRGLSQDDREILAIAALLGGRCTAELLLETATRLGYDQLLVRRVLRTLVTLGLVRCERSAYVESAELRQTALLALGSERQQLETAVFRTVLDLVAERKARLTPALLSAMAGRGEDWLPALREMLRNALDARRFERVANVLSLSTRLASRSGRAVTVAQIIHAAELRRALLVRNESRADRLFHSRSPSQAQTPFEQAVEGDTALEHTRYAAAKGNVQQAVTLCKRAILLHQESGEAEGLARANLEFGLLLLGQEKVSEARDYFIMARPRSEIAGESFEAVRARIAELTCLFVVGELTRVKDQIAPLQLRAQQLGLRETELFLMLLLGRVFFELGRYDEALTVFERGQCAAVAHDHPEARSVMRRWLGRCLAYLGDCEAALYELTALESGPEVRLFRAEALEHSSRLEEARSALLHQPPLGGRDGSAGRAGDTADTDTGGGAPSGARFQTLEQFAWDSGFASIEDCAIGRFTKGDSVLTRLTKAFSAYLLSLTGDADAAIEEFHRLTRQEKVSSIDPFNRLYFYFYSESLPWSKQPDREDRLTILGRSVRYMQERSSRIDLYQDKRAFLTSNYWNRQLLETARSHNLL